MTLIDRKDAPEMTDAEFRLIGKLLRERCGLHFGPESRFLLEKRIGRRLKELELTSFSAYHYLVRNASSGDGEFVQLIDKLTTNETYFFRERSQLRALMSEILPEVEGRRMHGRERRVDVAEPALADLTDETEREMKVRHSPQLTDDDLVEIVDGEAASGRVGAIARRPTVSHRVADAIAHTDDVEAIGCWPTTARRSVSRRWTTFSPMRRRMPPGIGRWSTAPACPAARSGRWRASSLPRWSKCCSGATTWTARPPTPSPTLCARGSNRTAAARKWRTRPAATAPSGRARCTVAAG